MDRDAQLNELIRLKQVPPAPIERWQMVATRPVPTTTSTCTNGRSPARFCGPKTPSNGPTAFSKTPESNRLVVKYKKTPKLKGRGTPSRSPPHGQSAKKKSPPKSAKKRTGHTPSGCRFIPNRSTTDLDYSSFLIQESIRKKKGKDKEGEEEEEESPGREEYRQTLLNALSRNRSQPRQRGVLSFKSATPSTSGSMLNYTSESLSTSKNNSSLRSSNRRSMKRTGHRLPTTADKILDAPGLIDDYYLNTLDWGRNNLVAIGLGPDVFLWNAGDGSVRKLLELNREGDYVCSVSWAGNGKYLAVGSNGAAIQLWDVEKEKRVRTMGGHTDRVGVLTWSKHTLTSGCRDGVIHHHDVRKAEHIVAHSQYHQLEVCGLKWSPDGTKLASGGNDNLVCIWNANNPSEPAQVLRGHQAAVKAIAWCPWHPNLLATGGGSSDKTIKFWNTYTQQCTESIDAKSQVSALAWNRENRALVSAHGAPKHQMTVWSYPSLTKVGELSGHQDRVLQMSLSPRKSTVCSAGADETLRIWNCFERTEHNASHKSYSEDSILALIHSAS